MSFRRKKREAKSYQLMSEAIETMQESLAKLVAQKRWMGELYENQNILIRLAPILLWHHFTILGIEETHSISAYNLVVYRCFEKSCLTES